MATTTLGVWGVPRTGQQAIGDKGFTPPSNVAPTAAFTYSTAGLTALFTDLSTDSDGTIASRDWDWGDGTTHGTTQNPQHTYAGAGTYTVTLTVTDDDGATDTETHDVSVSAAGASTGDRRRRSGSSGYLLS